MFQAKKPLTYDEKMQAYYKECNRLYGNNGNSKTAPVRTDADRLMAYHDGQTSSSGAIALIILGLPLLIVPPLGLAVIGTGLAMLGYGMKRGIEADAK
jgi:hypothetical protein